MAKVDSNSRNNNEVVNQNKAVRGQQAQKNKKKTIQIWSTDMVQNLIESIMYLDLY